MSYTRWCSVVMETEAQDPWNLTPQPLREGADLNVDLVNLSDSLSTWLSQTNFTAPQVDSRAQLPLRKEQCLALRRDLQSPFRILRLPWGRGWAHPVSLGFTSNDFLCRPWAAPHAALSQPSGSFSFFSFTYFPTGLFLNFFFPWILSSPQDPASPFSPTPLPSFPLSLWHVSKLTGKGDPDSPL